MSQKSKPAAFKAGFVACALLGFGALGYAGDLVLKEFRPDLEKTAIESTKTWVKDTFFEENLFSRDVYITLYYADGRDGHMFQTWKLSLKGRSHPYGVIEDQETGNKGVVNGYWRANTLMLSYASAASDRPGIGSFTLRPMLPGLAEKTVSFAGLGLVHECECKDGVKLNGPMLIVPAVLTNERIPPQEMKAAFFVKGPVEPDIVWPADLQKTASAQTR